MVLIRYLKRGLKKQKSQNEFRLYIINKKKYTCCVMNDETYVLTE